MTTQNQSLDTLVAQLDIQHTQKADYVVNPHKSLFMSPADGAIRIIGSKGGDYVPNRVFHDGMAEKLRIPVGYYRRMQQEAPELLAGNAHYRYVIASLDQEPRDLDTELSELEDQAEEVTL